MLKPIVIKGTNLPDVWHQTLFEAIKVGRDFTVDSGSYAGQKRKEFDFITIHSVCPGIGELLPKLNTALKLDDPCAQNYLDKYMPYLMTGEEKEGEAYTYGERICFADAELLFDVPENLVIDELGDAETDILPENIFWFDKSSLTHRVNQMELMIWTYKQLDDEGNPKYRNNQMTLQVGQPTDMGLKDPPCLRHIDTRIQDGKLHFFPYFRSWDLWGGMPAYLDAIELMRQYCAEAIGLDPKKGEIIASSKGLHLYNYVWKIAEAVRGKTAEEFKKEMSA